MAVVQTLAGNDFEPELPKRLLTIAEDIRAAGGRAYLVGGWVRDALLGKNCRDYDVEVYDLEQEELLPILSKYGKPNLVGKAFGVIHLAMKGESLDFSFPRTESKVGYGHKGFLVKTDAKLSFKEAALRRDFTINAMGMELPELTLCDAYGGIKDLKALRLRHVGPAFAEDSLRILRGVQFASRFGLTLAPETVELCRTLSLDDLSIERLFEEFKKWLLKPGKPSLGLRAFLDIKLDEYFPEIKPLASRWELLGELLDNLSAVKDFSDDERMVVMFAALLSGNASEGSCDEETVLKFLARITNEIKLVKGVPLLLRYAFSQAPASGAGDLLPSDSTIRRLSVALNGLRQLVPFIASNPLLEETQRHAFASALAKRAGELDAYEKAPVAYLTGKMLMNLGVKPGKQMGEVIKKSFELQLDGEITDADAAIAWARAELSL